MIDATTGDRQPIFAELDPNPNLNQPGDTQDVNLIIRPLEELHRGASLHRRPERTARRSEQPGRSTAGLPRLPGQADHPGSGGREPAPPHGGPDLDAAIARHPAFESVHELGLHRGQRAQPRGPSSRDSRQCPAPARRRHAGRRQSRRERADVPRFERRDQSRQPAGQHARAGRRRADERTLLPEQRELSPGRDVQLPVERRRGRHPDRNGGRPGHGHHRRAVPLPDSRTRRSPGERSTRRRAGSSGTACSATSPRSPT